MAKKAKEKKAAKKPQASAPKAPTRKAAEAPPAPKLDTSVLDELLATTGQPAPKAKETLPDFVLRVATAMAEVPDDKFNALSPVARKWYDENSTRYNEEKLDQLVALPGMPGYVAPTTAAEAAPQSTAPASAAKEDKQQEAPQTQTNEEDMAKGKGGKKAATKKAKTSNGNGAERALRTDSTSYQIRAAVVKNPDIAFDKVCEKVGLKGKDAAPTGHAHNMYQHAKIVMKIAAAEGYAKK